MRITKRELNQIYYLNRELEMWIKKKIEEEVNKVFFCCEGNGSRSAEDQAFPEYLQLLPFGFPGQERFPSQSRQISLASGRL